ncbi:hypothetical protein TIFTF001_024898 [Ficus carica]|uniref:Uncharacterized protein n=1 Tax=Ficus carica TaxID=3494 RepID=A0AA88AP29_FICCA|nr:hypothetical protein TIFTF001_024898 [Ficus carica]
MNIWSALQSPHGHWPAENGGSMFYIASLVFYLYISGTLDTVLNEHHKSAFLEKALMVVWTMLAVELANGFLEMVVQ